jgi:hypothetical protein
MDSHSQDNLHTESTPEMSNSPQHEEEHLFPEIPYALPHEELNQFKRITRAYTRQIGSLPLAPLLPHRKQVSRPIVDTLDHFFVHTVEDLIDFSLTEIEHPLNMILNTPASNYSKPDDFESDEEGFNSDHSASESDDMEDNNDNNEERGNPPQNNQPWLARDALEIHGRVHNLP